jgi:hypothetical protein
MNDPSLFTTQQAADPSSTGELLAAIAGARPDLRPYVASNPSTYPALLEWLGRLSDPAVDSALHARSSATPPPPPAAPPTAYTPTAVQQPMPLYVQPAPVLSPKLLASTTEYGKRRYKILMVMGDSVTMERAATKLNWLLAVLLFFLLVGVGAVPYILIWAIWGVHRTYRVMLSVSPQGEVQEVGDVLATFDRDRLKAHRIRCIVFGFLFAIVAGIMAIGTVGSLVWPSAGVSAPEPYVIVLGMVFTVVLPGIIAFVLFNSARKAARTLGIQAPTAVVDQGLTGG